MQKLLVCGGSKPIEKVVQMTLAIKLSTFAGGSWWPANGENAEKVVPELECLEEFGGDVVIHACDYKSSESYSGKRVLVVGCGNLGMEVPLCHVEHPEAIFNSIVVPEMLYMGITTCHRRLGEASEERGMEKRFDLLFIRYVVLSDMLF